MAWRRNPLKVMANKNEVPYRKTLWIAFSSGNHQFTDIYRLTGNDLETSETLYSVLFCTNQKNAFSYLQK